MSEKDGLKCLVAEFSPDIRSHSSSFMKSKETPRSELSINKRDDVPRSSPLA